MAAIILASASPARANLLRGAGVVFEIVPASVDEAAIKKTCQCQERTAEDTAYALAAAKALAVAASRPEALVIGADQMLDCAGVWFDKPRNAADAEESLKRLRGRTHRLISAVCAATEKDGVIWRERAEARLTMRAFSDGFLTRYLQRVGDEVTTSVGAYRLEGLGAQLFSRIEGDYFTILGLPLLALLSYLRDRGPLEC